MRAFPYLNSVQAVGEEVHWLERSEEMYTKRSDESDARIFNFEKLRIRMVWVTKQV